MDGKDTKRAKAIPQFVLNLLAYRQMLDLMSIDFHSRVDALADFLATEYRIIDRGAIDILLAAQLPLPHLPFPWIIIETAWDALDTTSAWFTFGGILPCGSLNEMRASRPRVGLDRIRAWREASGMGELSQRPLVFVESSFERPLFIKRTVVEYKPFVQQFIRLRTLHPKSGANLVLSANHASAKVEKLKSLTYDVIDCQFRDPVPAAPAVPIDFLYWCELAYKLNGGGRRVIWETLINQCAQAVIRRAYLYNREVEPADWSVAGRLLADSIPWWTMRTVECVSESECGYGSQERTFKYTKELTTTEELRKDHRRAITEGVLSYVRISPTKLHRAWRIPDDRIYRLVRGSAFDVQ